MSNKIRRLTLTTSAILALTMAAASTVAEAKKKDTGHQLIEVSDVKLFAQPENPVCGEPVHIIAEIRTTKPGAVEFMLHRREGRSQKASLTTQETDGGFIERWQKEYVYNHSVKREYRVVVKGGKQATSWMPVNVSCGGGSSIKGVASFRFH